MEFSDDDLIELSLLRGQEIDALVEHGFLSPERRFDDSSLLHLDILFPELVLEIHTGAYYPASQLTFAIDNLELARLAKDALSKDLKGLVEKDKEKNCVGRWSKRGEEGDGVFEAEMTALKLVQKTVEHISLHREAQRAPNFSPQPEPEPQYSEDNYYFKSLHIDAKNITVDDEGVDLSAVGEDVKTSYILGKSIEQILEDVPEIFRILHVENVVRSDLYSQFLARQETIKRRLCGLSQQELREIIPAGSIERKGDVETMADYLSAPKVTFHGTQGRSVPSIVKYGFMCPGERHPDTGQRLRIRCGNTYGRGIYSSPDAEFALSYVGEEESPVKPGGYWGMKLLVCATIMGRSATMYREDDWRVQTEPYAGADSHVGNNGKEYIVFEPSQILPCYVIHVDWGSHLDYFYLKVPFVPARWVKQTTPRKRKVILSFPGDKKRQREAVFARASKYFPYGYGPATGSSFIVEDVGEIDDDEEEYGQYQKDRIDAFFDGEKQATDFWEWDAEDARLKGLAVTEKDEYVDERFGFRNKRK